MPSPIEKREAQRKGYCRGCDCQFQPGEQIIATYSWRNRGQHIFFCLPCGEEIGTLASAPA